METLVWAYGVETACGNGSDTSGGNGRICSGTDSNKWNGLLIWQENAKGLMVYYRPYTS